MQRLVIAGIQGITGTFKQWEEPSIRRRSELNQIGGRGMLFLHPELNQAQKAADLYPLKWPENCLLYPDCHCKPGI
jgi:hypothetical protein